MGEDRGKTATGARGDFVAQLGRRVSELRHGVALWEADGASSRLRDDLRRRAHALASAARVLRFAGLSERLSGITALIDRTAPGRALPSDAVSELRVAIEELPALAWGDAPSPDRAPISSPIPLSRPASGPPTSPTIVLVVGPQSLGTALDPFLDDRGHTGDFEWERAEGGDSARDLARALAPDVIVLDGDLEGAEALAAAIRTDAFTEPVPLVVVATLRTPGDAARWLSAGASDVLAKPISRERLRLSCRDVRARGRAQGASSIGEATLQEVVTRLETELRRGLLEAVPERARQIAIPVGEGHELLAALWSMVARVREVLAERSRGVLRFDSGGPEGALPIASWSGGDQAGGPSDGPRLAGRLVLVADDDPAVTWFLAGVLRAAGAEVLTAPDGEAALGMAYRASPDLVISDVLMPKLDGFALCRALKRDVALRDVPVILLSWKEDLLQRVRELGASADGYLRKEASGSLVLERAEEVLRPRARVEARLRLSGDVNGRIDGLTVPTLLRLVARHRPDARVTIRDACYLYEIELRETTPTSLTRTASDGSFSRGPAVASTVLGVTAGRFVVANLAGSAKPRGALSLESWLDASVARIRAAQRLLSGASLLDVREVGIDLDALGPYLTVMPEPSRLALLRLSEGESPFELVRKSTVPPRLLEDVLADAAAHGGISRVVGPKGEDALARGVLHEEAVLRRGVTASLFPPTPDDGSPTVRAPASDGPLALIPRAPALPRYPSAPPDEVLGDEDEISTPRPESARALPPPRPADATRDGVEETVVELRAEFVKHLEEFPHTEGSADPDGARSGPPSEPTDPAVHRATTAAVEVAAPRAEPVDRAPYRAPLPSWSDLPTATPHHEDVADLDALFRASAPPKALHPVVVLGDDDESAPQSPSLLPLREPISQSSKIPTLRPAPPPRSPAKSDPKIARPSTTKPRPTLLTAESLIGEVLAEKGERASPPPAAPRIQSEAPTIELAEPAPLRPRRKKKADKTAFKAAVPAAPVAPRGSASGAGAATLPAPVIAGAFALVLLAVFALSRSCGGADARGTVPAVTR